MRSKVVHHRTAICRHGTSALVLIRTIAWTFLKIDRETRGNRGFSRYDKDLKDIFPELYLASIDGSVWLEQSELDSLVYDYSWPVIGSWIQEAKLMPEARSLRASSSLRQHDR
jgi:hypothetical protein